MFILGIVDLPLDWLSVTKALKAWVHDLQVPYLQEALKVWKKDGSAGVGEGPGQDGGERGVQAHDGPHALRSHGQVLGCDGPQACCCQGASPQHQLACARVEHLQNVNNLQHGRHVHICHHALADIVPLHLWNQRQSSSVIPHSLNGMPLQAGGTLSVLVSRI